jgi:hypothetical protein
MANAISTQIILDGTRNAVIKFEGVLDTADLTSTVVADPATMQGMDFIGTLKAAKFRVIRIHHNIEDGLSVNLFWDANTPVRIEELTGRGSPDYHKFGGLPSNATDVPTGKITATTEGWSGIKSFSVILELVKTL